MGRSENARGLALGAGLHVAVATLWAKGEGIRERIPAMLGWLACWTGKGISGCNTGDRSRAARTQTCRPRCDQHTVLLCAQPPQRAR